MVRMKKNVHSLLRVEFKVPPFLTGFIRHHNLKFTRNQQEMLSS